MLYFWATGRHFNEAHLGASHVTEDTDMVAHFISDSVEDLETRVNAWLAAITTEQTTRLLASIHISGAGDREQWCVSAVANTDTGGGVPSAPADENSTGTRVFFYKAETEPELAVQFAACKARIVAWLEEGTLYIADYIDHQIAGAQKGANHMGMIVLYRNAGPQ